VNSGFVQTDLRQGGTISVSGTEGFSLTGSVHRGSVQPSGFTPLPAGSTVPVNALWGGSDVPGTLTLAGVTFPSYTQGVTPGSTAWDFDAGSVTLPALGNVGDVVVLTSPFTVTGSVITPPLSGPSPAFEATLFGQGLATLTLQRTSAEAAWLGRDLRFDFEESPSPVPEPSTLLLAASGLAAIHRIRRRRRSSGTE
jgi:MYXO-CTERM domain-containing protein